MAPKRLVELLASHKFIHATMRFQVLTATSMHMTVFSDTMPCDLVEIDRRFRGA